MYLARILGVANFGVLEFAGSVLAYLLLIADCGFEMWGTREAANSSDIPAPGCARGADSSAAGFPQLRASAGGPAAVSPLSEPARGAGHLRADRLCPGGEPEVGVHGTAADVGRGSRAGDRAGGFRGAGGGVYPQSRWAGAGSRRSSCWATWLPLLTSRAGLREAMGAWRST